MRSLFLRTWRRLALERAPADLSAAMPPKGRSVYVLASQRRRRRSIHHEYRARIAGARRSVDLAHAYFIPDAAIRRALFWRRRARRSGSVFCSPR